MWYHIPASRVPIIQHNLSGEWSFGNIFKIRIRNVHSAISCLELLCAPHRDSLDLLVAQQLPAPQKLA